MDYSLALQLQEAGFPQEGKSFTYLPSDIVATKDYVVGDIIRGEVLGYCYVPTLDELVEACLGNGLFILQQAVVSGEQVWQAKLYGSNLGYFNAPTPLEAVAHLYIALNKK